MNSITVEPLLKNTPELRTPCKSGHMTSPNFSHKFVVSFPSPLSYTNQGTFIPSMFVTFRKLPSSFFLSSFPLILVQTLAAGRWPLAGGPCLHCNWSVRGSVLRAGDQVQNSHHLLHRSPQHSPIQVSPWSRSQTNIYIFLHIPCGLIISYW